MLTTIREKTQGIIATFIIVLIAIPFALWGINSYFEGGRPTEVAKVNGHEISERMYRSTLEGFRRQIDPRRGDSAEMKKLVIDGLVDQILLVQDAERQGYRIDDARLAQTIRRLPYFQTGGQFDPNLYESLLRREGMGAREFENHRRAEAVTMQLRAGLTESGIVTESEIAAVVRLLGQQREVAHAVIGADRFQTSVTVTAEAIQQYYDAHPDFFRTLEQVRIEYLRLSAQELIKDYRPSDAELEAAFAEEAAKLAIHDARRAAHILVSLPPGAPEDDAKAALAKIQDIERQARGGTDFGKLARTHSDDKDTAAKGGDLGEIRQGSLLPKALLDAVIPLRQGEISTPVRTEYGYHLVRITAYKQKSLQELKPQLVKQLRQRKIEESFYEASEKFRNITFEQPDSLVPTAEALGLKVESTDWFGRGGGIGPVAAHPRVVEAAFSAEVLEQRRNSDTIEISGDTLVAVRVAGHRPSVLKPLAEVRPQIERALRQELAEKAARELGEQVVGALAAGEPLDALARKHRLQYQPAKTLLRDQPQGVDARIVEAAFRAARPENGKPASGGIELGGKGYAVYTVTRVTDADPAKADAATREKARRLLMTRRGPDYYANYGTRLKQKADVRIYQERL